MGRLGRISGWILLGLFCLSEAGEAQEDVWVFFRDKSGPDGEDVVWRGSGAEHSMEELDLPVDARYIARIQEGGMVLRVHSRWLNAASVCATAEQRRWLATQPFVVEIRPVGKFRRPVAPRQEVADLPLRKATVSLDYGPSFDQLAQIGVIGLHQLGYEGEGVRIALLDNGFHYTEHEGFAQLRVVAERDFVNGDEIVSDQVDQPVTGDEMHSKQNIHGAQVLSLLAGYQPGRFIGVAPRAEYILAKTEENARELPVEEDYWIAGLEWADSLGADVVSSSLGYNIWDDGSGYTYEQLDGATALTTVAAEAAVRKGIVVVAAAGNEGDGPWRYVTVPADAPGVISVGSVNIPKPGQDPVLASSSSRGPTADGRIKPDVVAPGQGVVVANIRGGDYVPTNGTSFATPLVSGVCALLLQIHPSWTPVQVQEAVRRTATDLGEAGQDTAYGWGQVNALRASGLDLQRPEVTLSKPPFPNPATGNEVFFPLQLAEEDQVELRVFDLAGGLVAVESWSLVAYDYTRPEQSPRWEVPDEIADGLYFFQLKSSNFTHAGKIALIRHRSQKERRP